jgi:hypothetical protein
MIILEGINFKCMAKPKEFINFLIHPSPIYAVSVVAWERFIGMVFNRQRIRFTALVGPRLFDGLISLTGFLLLILD